MKRGIVIVLAGMLMLAPVASLAKSHVSQPFKEVKVNGGTVTIAKETGKIVLTLSDDFQAKIAAPDPHWMVVDSKGNTYLLQRFEIKDNKFHRKITLPAYAKDVAKVQFWCAFAELVLGEADFKKAK